MRLDYWYDSGMAAAAAREVIWFAILVFVAIGFVIWLDIRKDK